MEIVSEIVSDGSCRCRRVGNLPRGPPTIRPAGRRPASMIHAGVAPGRGAVPPDRPPRYRPAPRRGLLVHRAGPRAACPKTCWSGRSWPPCRPGAGPPGRPPILMAAVGPALPLDLPVGLPLDPLVEPVLVRGGGTGGRTPVASGADRGPRRPAPAARSRVAAGSRCPTLNRRDSRVKPRGRWCPGCCRWWACSIRWPGQ